MRLLPVSAIGRAAVIWVEEDSDGDPAFDHRLDLLSMGDLSAPRRSNLINQAEDFRLGAFSSEPTRNLAVN
jgi:hypothetical protein